MHFQINKLVLWPIKPLSPRILEFTLGEVNVISGDSKTGKTAVIPIIDYCLGSGRCTIPVGVIRESCSWFGIVVDTIEGQKLLARRAPGAQKATGDMFIVEGPKVHIPNKIEEKNENVDGVRRLLDRLSGLTNLSFDPTGESGFKGRPSFRDLMAFTFQPQNIVANPDVLFFKADTAEHREKLKTIFPYVLRAITPEVLAARHELELLLRDARRKEIELGRLRAATDPWKAEALVWLRQAIDFGLLDTQELPAEWPARVDLMKAAIANSPKAPTMTGIDSNLSRVDELRAIDAELARDFAEHRQRLMELNRMKGSSDAYGQAVRAQKDRLSLANWMRSLVANAESEGTLAAIAGSPLKEMEQLCAALDGIELQLKSLPRLTGSLDREILAQRTEAAVSLGLLNAARSELEALERSSIKARYEAYGAREIQRFVGKMEQALEVFEQSDISSPLVQGLSDLNKQISQLRKQIQEGDIRRRLDAVLDDLQKVTGKIIPNLDAEWDDAPIRLSIDDLSVKVRRDGRDDYLWEIGSGANWLAYHVAITLALQRFFLSTAGHEVPSLLVYDQPSQVYFPKQRPGLKQIEEGDAPQLMDQDVEAVRKVFAELGATAERAEGRLQIIVLDHADDAVWDGLPKVKLVEEWRNGLKLVPDNWKPHKQESKI